MYFNDIPFDDIVACGSKDMIENDLFTVSWILGRFCNYNCSYCWPYARSSVKDHRDTELCLLTIDEIKRQARERGFNSFHWSLSGGEPTFHPGYFDILRHLAEDNENCNFQRIHMTSNCSRNLKWFQEYVVYARQFKRAAITASAHFESLNTPEKVDDWIEKLLYVQSEGVYVTVNMVMVPERFWDFYSKAKYIKSRGIHVTLKPQSNENASAMVQGYTEEMISILTEEMKTGSLEITLFDSNNTEWGIDQAERLNAFGFNKFKGWECSSGYRSIIIREPDGNIKRSYSCKDEPLGNITNGFTLYPDIKKCISESCVSSADSKIPKRKYGKVIPLWKLND